MENTEEILVAIEENPPVIEENRQSVEEIVPNSGGILENSTESEIIEDPAPVEKKKKPRSPKTNRVVEEGTSNPTRATKAEQGAQAKSC